MVITRLLFFMAIGLGNILTLLNISNIYNKPGQCPTYNGRKRRSPEQLSSSGRTFGNNGGWNNGGQGYNPGYNYGRCIRDSECPGSLKCCYLYNGYQCTQPQYYG